MWENDGEQGVFLVSMQLLLKLCSHIPFMKPS